ncbi:MAG: hypothetical protein ACRD1T_15925 [Acidimicrobiia bacterium]
MKTRSRLIVIGTAAVILAFSAGVAIRAFNPQPEPPGKAALGLTTNEKLQVNVSNLTSRICTVQLQAFDADGNMIIIINSRPMLQGESAFFDVFKPARAEMPSHVRVELRSEPPHCATSVTEVVDLATQKTLAIYAGTPNM